MKQMVFTKSRTSEIRHRTSDIGHRASGMREEGGFVLVASLAALVLLLLLGVGVLGIASQSAKAESRRYWLASAKWYAHAGTEYGAWQLTSTDSGSSGEGSSTPDFSWGLNGETLDLDGQEIEIDVDDNVPAGAATLRRIRAESDIFTRTGVARSVIDTKSIPLVFDYALAANGTLDLRGTAVDVYDPLAVLNANIFSNTSVDFIGQPTVRGFVTTAGTVTGNFTNVLPVTNPGNQDVTVEGLPRYDFGPLQRRVEDNVPIWRAAAQAAGTYYAGNYTVNNITVNLNGGVMFVEGTLTMRGNVRIVGGGTIVAQNVVMSGNGSVTYAGVPDTSPYRIIARQTFDINMTGTPMIMGQMYAGGNFLLRGTPTVVGSIVSTSLDTSGVKGNADVRYVPSDWGLNVDLTGLRRLSYQERQAGQTW